MRIEDGCRLRQKTWQSDGLAQTCPYPALRPHLCELTLLWGYDDGTEAWRGLVAMMMMGWLRHVLTLLSVLIFVSLYCEDTMSLYLYNEDWGYDDAKTLDTSLASIDTIIHILLPTPTVGVQQSNIFRASGYFNCLAFASTAPKAFYMFQFCSSLKVTGPIFVS